MEETKIKESFEKKIKEQLKQVSIEESKLEILKTLPSFVKDALDSSSLVISEHSAYSDFSVHCKVETLNDAILIAEKVNPVAMFRVSGSCLSFQPERAANKANEELYDIESVCPYYYEVKSFFWEEKRQLSQDHFLVCCFELGQRLLTLKIKIEKPEAKLHFHYEKIKGRVITHCDLEERSGHFTKTDRFYATHGQPNNFIRYA